MAEAAVFIDTGYFVALLNRRDALHDQAMALAKRWDKRKRPLITSDAVFIELANFFSRSPLRGPAHAAIQRIRAAHDWTVEPIEPAMLARAEKRYGTHLDKEWSLTDCISMELMTQHALRDAATADKHFAQAGFRALMS